MKTNETKNQMQDVTPATTGGPASPIAQAADLLQQAAAVMAETMRPVLTARERKSLLKVRRNGIQFVPTLVQLTATRPQLAPNGTDPTALAAALATLEQMRGFANLLTGFEAQVADTVRQLETEMWKLGLDIYAIAERSKGDAAVANVVAEVRAALATGPRYPRFVRVSTPKPVVIHVPTPEPVITFVTPASPAQAPTATPVLPAVTTNGSTAPDPTTH